MPIVESALQQRRVLLDYVGQFLKPGTHVVASSVEEIAANLKALNCEWTYSPFGPAQTWPLTAVDCFISLDVWWPIVLTQIIESAQNEYWKFPLQGHVLLRKC